MIKALSLFALFNNIEAQNFTTIPLEGRSMEYRVSGNALEFNQYLVPVNLKKIKACQQFFNQKKAPKLPFRVTEANGYVIECNDLPKGKPFGVNLKLTGLTADELLHFSNMESTITAPHVFDAEAFNATHNTTCFGNCTTTYAGKTANILSLNADVLPGFDLPKTLNLAYDFPMTDMRNEAIAKSLGAYDVVGLQEIYVPKDNGRKLKFIEHAASVGLTNYALPVAAVPEGFTTDGGQLILSRFPIVARDFSAFAMNDLSSDAIGI
jgi:hypothetical protein